MSMPTPVRSVLTAITLLAGAGLLTTTPAAADVIVVKTPDFPRPAHPPIGINLEPVMDYSRSMMFVDMIKSARKFGSADAPWDEKAPLDDQGWPKGDCGTVVVADSPVPPGDYLFSCDGRCEVSLLQGKGTVKQQNYDHDKKQTTATITMEDGGNLMFLSFKKTSGGIKNIRLLRPGYPLDTREVFNKDFLNALKPFSTMRFMDIMRTNDTKVTEWDERAKVTDPMQSSVKGIAWEYAIMLANQTGKDMWINIPVQASDDYVKQLAKLIKSSLNKDRCVYVEYSNEVWNTIFPQYHWNYEKAKEEVEKGGEGGKALTDDYKDDNTYFHGWKRVAKRLVEISNIFKDVYADKEGGANPNAINTVIRPVLASQSAIPTMLRMQVKLIEKYYGPPSKFIYGIAGAPYIGPDKSVAGRPGSTADQLLDSAADSGMKWIKDVTLQYQTVARFYRLHSLCYEGGPGFDGEHSVEGKIAANRDPRIGKLITDYLNAWYGTGGELFMYFNLASGYGKFGSWGLTEDIRKETPKTKAVAEVAAEPLPPETVGASIPGTVMAYDFTANGGNGGGVEKSSDGGKNLAFLGDGNSFDYLLNVKEAGDYVVTVKYATGADNSELEPLLSSVSLGTLKLKSTGGWQQWGNAAPIPVRLEKGQLVLRLDIKKSGMNIRSVSFEKK
jgi:hypothetical protein